MYIASTATDLKLHVWPGGELFNTYNPNDHGLIRSLSWSKDGNWITMVPSNSPVEIVIVGETTVRSLYTINEVQYSTCTVFQNLTKRYIAIGTNAGSVVVFDMKTRNLKKHFPKAPAAISLLQYGMKDNFLLSACENGSILSYSTTSMNRSGTYQIPNSKSVSTLRTHSTRKNLFMAGSNEGVIAVWDINRNNIIHTNPTHQAPVTDVAFSPIRPDLIVTCGMDRKFTFTDTTTRKAILEQIIDSSPTAIDFCPDGIGLALGTQSGMIYSYDTRRMSQPLHKFKAHQSCVLQVLCQKNCVNESGDYGITHNYNRQERDVVFTEETPKEDSNIIEIYDSFKSVLANATNEDIQQYSTKNSTSEMQGDSFLNAMGMSAGSINDTHPGSISEGVKKLLGSKPHLLDASSEPLVTARRNRLSSCDGVLQAKEASKNEDQYEHNSRAGSMRGNGRTSLGTPQSAPRRRSSTTDARVRFQTIVEDHRDDCKQKETQTDHNQCSAQMSLRNVLIDSIKNQSQLSSTPKPTFQHKAHISNTCILSPIVNEKQNSPSLSAELREIMEDVVKKEFKNQFEVFHQNWKVDMREMMDNTRQNFLNLKFSVIKEFVLMEKCINKMKEEVASHVGITDDSIMLENMMLRQEIAFLKEQLFSKNVNQ